MSDFDKQLIPIYAAVKRQEIRCICIVTCVVIVAASALGAMFYCIPPPFCATNEPITYEYITESGATVTTTTSGNSTVTVITDSNGRIISTSIVGGRKSRAYIKRNAAERKARQERKAAKRAERKARREASRQTGTQSREVKAQGRTVQIRGIIV